MVSSQSSYWRVVCATDHPSDGNPLYVIRVRLYTLGEARAYRRVGKHVIGTPRVLSIPQLRSHSTNFVGNSADLWIWLSSLSLNLVGVDPMPLDVTYSSQAHCTAETCLLALDRRRSTRI